MELRNVHVSYGNKVPGTHGDLWPMAWADDDELYAAVSDTLGCPEGLYKKGRNVAIARVTGSPGSPSIHILKLPQRVLTRNRLQMYLLGIDDKVISAQRTEGIL